MICLGNINCSVNFDLLLLCRLEAYNKTHPNYRKEDFMSRMNPYVYMFSLGHFSVDWAQSAFPALLPYFITLCSLSYRDATALLFANILLASVIQPVLGYYSDKVSKPWFIPFGVLLSGLSLTALAFTDNYSVIFICSMLSGLGSSIYHPEAARMVNEISGAVKGKAMGTFSVGGSVGFAVGPIIAGLCAYAFDIHGLAVFAVVNTGLALFLYHHLPKVLAQIDRNGIVEETVTGRIEKRNDWSSFSRLTVVIFARSISFAVCNAFIPLFWVKVLGRTPSEGSLALSLLFAIGVVGTYVGGLIADRTGFVKVMRVAITLMVPAMYFFVHSTTALEGALFIVPVGLTLFAPYSAIVVLGQTFLGKNVGFASGVTLGLSITIGGLLTPLVGWAADIWGIPTALQVLWICAAIGAIFTFSVREPKDAA